MDQKKTASTLWISLASILCTGALCFYTVREVHELKQEVSKVKKTATTTVPVLGGTPTPIELRNTPLGEEVGVVLGTKTVSIRNAIAPYNASLIESGSEYLLFFRYDVWHPFLGSTSSHIGVAELDANFEQTATPFKTIDTHSNHSEDPRAIKVGKDLYLSYNDVQAHSMHSRSIRVAQVNLDNFSLHFSTSFYPHLQPVEKNWVPFEYMGKDNAPTLHFEYCLNPHTIFKIPDPRQNQFAQLTFPDFPSPPKLPWTKKWGVLRGGTPARKVGNEYLAFFHSSFTGNEGIVWYVMGAYTFEAQPPFRITGISNYPLLFKGIYDSPLVNTANHRVRCIFPSGFVVENREGREVIHVSCGENDSAVKIITLDKEALFQSLYRF